MRNSYKKARKYTRGVVIQTSGELMACANNGTWVYFGDKVYHPTWIINMNFSCVCNYIKNGQLCIAHRNKEWPYIFVAKDCMDEVPERESRWWISCSEIPNWHQTEISKDAVIAECEKAAIEKSGLRNPRIQVRFEREAYNNKPVALIQ